MIVDEHLYHDDSIFFQADAVRVTLPDTNDFDLLENGGKNMIVRSHKSPATRECALEILDVNAAVETAAADDDDDDVIMAVHEPQRGR